ncbi:MAG TPA: hypothetical protein VLT90_03065 [Terriglobales bacterium]|nr:hypothetical protein [Terriglobales bacterium]
MSRVDGIHRTRGEGETISYIQPEISLGERIRIDVDKTWQIFGSAAEVHVERSLRSPQTPKKAPQKMVGKSGFGDRSKGNVFVALM